MLQLDAGEYYGIGTALWALNMSALHFVEGKV